MSANLILKNEKLGKIRSSKAEDKREAQTMLEKYDLNQDGELDAAEIANMQSDNPKMRTKFGRRHSTVLREDLDKRKICGCCRKPGPVSELVLYGIFMITFTVYCGKPRAETDYFMANILRETFSFEEFGDHNEKNFYDIVNADDFWGWVEGPLLGGLYFEDWYNGEGTSTAEAAHIVMYNRVLGGIRMRQVRVKEDTSCHVPKPLKKVISKCYPRFTPAQVSDASFGNSDGLSDADKKWFTHTPDFNPHTSASYSTESQSFIFEGGYNPTGGYNAMLPNTNSTRASYVVSQLKARRWIDQATRLVSVDLNVYNPNIAKFGIVRFDVEFLASGGAVATSSFKVQQLEMNPDKIFEDPDLLFMMICTCVLLSFNLWYFFLEVAELCQKGWKEYASDFWNYLEIINMTLLMISTGGLFYWRWEGFTLLETFDPASDTYIPLHNTSFWVATFVNLNGINCVLTYLKVFKFLGVSPKMAQMVNTVAIASEDLLVFLIAFFIVLLGFMFAFYVTLGSEISGFRTYEVTLFTLFNMLLGDFDYQEIKQTNIIFGPLLFFFYIIIVFFILFNMFLAIITDAYAQMRTELEASEGKVPDPLAISLQRSYHDFKACLRCRKHDHSVQIVRKNNLESEDPDALPTSNTITLKSGGATIKIPVDELLQIAAALGKAVDDAPAIGAKRAAAQKAQSPGVNYRQGNGKSPAGAHQGKVTPSQIRVYDDSDDTSDSSNESSD